MIICSYVPCTDPGFVMNHFNVCLSSEETSLTTLLNVSKVKFSHDISKGVCIMFRSLFVPHISYFFPLCLFFFPFLLFSSFSSVCSLASFLPFLLKASLQVLNFFPPGNSGPELIKHYSFKLEYIHIIHFWAKLFISEVNYAIKKDLVKNVVFLNSLQK